jgi:hypothetical protein
MTQLGRSRTIGFLVFLVLGATASWAQTRPPIAAELAKTYGLQSFGKIEAIRYTFNAQLPGVKLSRSWVWHPKTDQVSFEGKDKDGKPVKVTYFRSQVDGATEQIDAAFLNDQYNLLFPLHVDWDTNTEVQDLGVQKLPLGEGSAKRVVVKYPSDGGYTPGDTWELFLGSDGRVEEFVYRRGAPTPPPSLVVARWEGYRKVGPLLVATSRPGTADGKAVRVFFTDVSVKLAGSDKWVDAQ